MHLLQDTEVLKVGIGVRADVIAVQTQVAGFSDRGSFVSVEGWLGERFPKVRRLGMRNAAATLLDIRVAKSQQMKNWAQEMLTTAMLIYAACDACIGLVLYQVARGLGPSIQLTHSTTSGGGGSNSGSSSSSNSNSGRGTSSSSSGSGSGSSSSSSNAVFSGEIAGTSAVMMGTLARSFEPNEVCPIYGQACFYLQQGGCFHKPVTGN